MNLYYRHNVGYYVFGQITLLLYLCIRKTGLA